jgi:hypothetical protein
MAEVTTIVVRIGASGAVKRFSGRFAWALSELIRAGKRGVTPIDRPAPRWSHYVYRLRRDGIPIKTLPEKHAGAFPGRHGRYVIADAVTVVGDAQVKGKAA